MALSGSQAGTIVAFPLSAAIINSLGWEAVFYIQAVITLVWCASWFLFTADNIEKDKRISKAERDYIYATIGDSKDKTVSWRASTTMLLKDVESNLR